jgi:hypothetical protein
MLNADDPVTATFAGRTRAKTGGSAARTISGAWLDGEVIRMDGSGNF